MLSAGQEFVAWQRAWMVDFNAANLATLVSSAAPFFVAPVLKIYWLDLSFVTGYRRNVTYKRFRYEVLFLPNSYIETRQESHLPNVASRIVGSS